MTLKLERTSHNSIDVLVARARPDQRTSMTDDSVNRNRVIGILSRAYRANSQDKGGIVKPSALEVLQIHVICSLSGGAKYVPRHSNTDTYRQACEFVRVRIRCFREKSGHLQTYGLLLDSETRIQNLLPIFGGQQPESPVRYIRKRSEDWERSLANMSWISIFPSSPLCKPRSLVRLP